MFHVVSYNIFARSLGSNCIPWVLKVSLEWENRVAEATGKPWKTFVKEYLWPEYTKHFHKNHGSGNKIEMRQLWSMNVQGSHHIPVELTGVRFISEDCLEYNITTASDSGSNTSDKTTSHNILAFTLPGVLKKYLPASLYDGLYAHIMKTESNYLWANRGPKIFQEITRSKPEFAQCPVPGIISLCEYDVHTTRAAYRSIMPTRSEVASTDSIIDRGDDCPQRGQTQRDGQDEDETFAEAMHQAGYAGVLMSSPDLRDRSGIGVYWKSEQFRLEHGDNVAPSSEIFVLPGDSLNDSAFNYDLNESYHKLSPDSNSSTYETLEIAERKHISCVRLVHKNSGKLLLVVSAHLMTASKDTKANEYVGEIRACQLKRMSEIVAMHMDERQHRAVDGVVVMGDFNTDIAERNILTGLLTSQLAAHSVLSIETGLVEAEQPCRNEINKNCKVNKKGGGTALQWHINKNVTTAPSSSVSSVSSVAATFYSTPDSQAANITKKCKTECKMVMHETFADIHQWGTDNSEHPATHSTETSDNESNDGVIDTISRDRQHSDRDRDGDRDSGDDRHITESKREHCTSYSTSRCSWIDLVWYPPTHLRVIHTTPAVSLRTPAEPMPNSHQPSDHLPLAAVFEFVG